MNLGKSQVKELLLEEIDKEEEKILKLLEKPHDSDLGDLALPCHSLAKKRKTDPEELAEEIGKSLEVSGEPLIEKVKVVGPYVNFFYDRNKFSEKVVNKVVEDGKEFGDSNRYEGEQVIIDMIGLNPNKAGHIGHVRSGCIGDTLARCMKKVGYKVVKESFVNDLGVPTAMVFWAYKNLEDELPERTGLLEKEDQWQGRVYEKMQKLCDEDQEIKDKVDELHQVLEEGENTELVEEQRKLIDKCVEAQSETWERLGCSLDLNVHESDIVRSGMIDLAVEKLKEADAVYEKDDALYFKLSQYSFFEGMENPDKVLIRPDGRATYTGKDIALQLWKHRIIPDEFKYKLISETEEQEEYVTNNLTGESMDRGFNENTKSVYVIGAEQKYVIATDLYSLKALGHEDYFERGHHLAHGLVGFGDEAKISSREGAKGLTADEVLDKAKSMALEEVEDRNPDMEAEKQKSLAEAIGSSAVRYYLINTDPIKFVEFDFDEALSFEGDTGPYLQYSLVRAKRILEKSEKEPDFSTLEPLSKEEEFELIKKIAEFPKAVEESAERYKPHIVANYAFDLASIFSNFYEKCPVIQAEDRTEEMRLALVKAFTQTMRNCLNLLGIEEVDAM